MAKTKNISVQSPKAKKPAPVKIAKVTQVVNKCNEVIAKPYLPAENINPIAPVPNSMVTANESVDTTNTLTQVENEPRSGRGVVFGLIGGSVVAYMAYSSLKSVFTDKGYDKAQAHEYALISAGVSALLTFTILYRLIK